MKDYIFKTTVTMKNYNNYKWWIDGDIVTEKRISAENLTAALQKYRETVKRIHHITISDNAIKNKQVIHTDTDNGVKQCGYVITGKTAFLDDQGQRSNQCIDLRVTVLTVCEPDFE